MSLLCLAFGQRAGGVTVVLAISGNLLEELDFGWGQRNMVTAAPARVKASGWSPCSWFPLPAVQKICHNDVASKNCSNHIGYNHEIGQLGSVRT